MPLSTLRAGIAALPGSSPRCTAATTACTACNSKLLRDPHGMYTGASDKVRRRLNQAIFKRIYVFNEEITGHELQPALVRALPGNGGSAQRPDHRSSPWTPPSKHGDVLHTSIQILGHLTQLGRQLLPRALDLGQARLDPCLRHRAVLGQLEQVLSFDRDAICLYS
ncbi:hypothetical protein [Nocardia farcinica]|uniref:hypothetical protein n=1 Tax=Nocardia farcinica TaxID=37329 RepID=UPI001145ACF7|nr:hypothetical protein [Nocardia farcinica]